MGPHAIRAFLKLADLGDAVRKAFTLGGNSDAITCVTGGTAQASHVDVPWTITHRVHEVLNENLARITKQFKERYVSG